MCIIKKKLIKLSNIYLFIQMLCLTSFYGSKIWKMQKKKKKKEFKYINMDCSDQFDIFKIWKQWKKSVDQLCFLRSGLHPESILGRPNRSSILRYHYHTATGKQAVYLTYKNTPVKFRPNKESNPRPQKRMSSRPRPTSVGWMVVNA